MERILFDIETNGLLDELDIVHSLVMIDLDTGRLVSCADQEGYISVAEGIDILYCAKLLVGHNIQGFDLPALHKVFQFDTDAELHDTLIMSRLIWSDLKHNDFRFLEKNPEFPKQLIGSHSLKAWGYRLGNHKDEYDGGWDAWSKDMQDYCEQDTRANLTFYEKILSKKPSAESVKLEHDFAHVIRKQERHGFNFDEDAATKLLAQLQVRQAELEQDLQTAFPPWEIKEPFVPKVNNKTRGYVKGQLTYKVKTVVFNPASRDHIADRLQKLRNWKPEDFTAQGKPKVDEQVLSKLDYPEAKILNEYLLINKRIGQLATGTNAWLKLVRNGKIHGQVNTNGAATGRCTHNRPNIAQCPSVGAEYGTECRSLFVAPDGYKLVGADLSGLELRCLAHYMAKYDGGAYGEVVVNGDIHTLNQQSAGLPTRNSSKTFIYGFLYGAGPAKIGSIVGGSEREGRKLISKFMKATPAIKQLREGVSQQVKKNGYLKGLDGRHLPIRSDHAALNTLLQSAGALLAKKATVFLYENLTAMGYIWGVDYAQVAHVHDEVQLIAREDIADVVGQQAVKSFQQAGEHFNFRCPITGEYKVGRNWAETH
ncbi:DNA polymerase [Roseobacter phage CRP-113]|uniref:DNA polymerase n=1 Tax=Roseobacter phage CRP-113 TaxID=3072841 RepID=A0AAX3ZXJ0_9CAUD|nr:DNA polymerase [Roseobacter phage CRP-113]